MPFANLNFEIAVHFSRAVVTSDVSSYPGLGTRLIRTKRSIGIPGFGRIFPRAFFLPRKQVDSLFSKAIITATPISFIVLLPYLVKKLILIHLHDKVVHAFLHF
jgi:hypothetical protein